jgi:hypothetical protein
LRQRLKQLGYCGFGVGQRLLDKSRCASFERKAAIPWVNVSRPPMNFHAIADPVQLQSIAPCLTPANQSQDLLNPAAVPVMSQPIQAGL